MSGAQATESLVPGTLSLCAELGRLVRDARAAHDDPVAARGRRGCAGGGCSPARSSTSRGGPSTGFARGEARLSGMDADAGAELVLRFQNEHLVAEVDGAVVASVPDLICTLDRESGDAVTTGGSAVTGSGSP